ncbi:hypothetical protein SRHO_G00025580 [Serrasalmus rhombeus]
MGRPSCRFADLIIASEIIIFRRRRRRVSLLARTKSKSTPQHRPSAHQLTPCPIMIKQESKAHGYYSQLFWISTLQGCISPGLGPAINQTVPMLCPSCSAIRAVGKVAVGKVAV